MITLDEIREVAAQVRLQPTIVEKDYALGWLLAGIHHHPALKDRWVFKGGTCLKKCYFETYRFSEDLDFSCPKDGIPTEQDLKTIFAEISEWVMSAAGLEIPVDGLSFEVFQNPRATESIQGKISYRGPVRPQLNVRGLPRIKLDLTFDEPVVLAPVIREVSHPYSDAPSGGIKVLCYGYEEIFAEKTRALAQRLRPRDLYDVIHLHRRLDLNPNQKVVRETLETKCKTRGIAFPTFEALQNHSNRTLLESEWENQLGHQLPTLPPFDQFLGELSVVVEWLSGVEEEVPADFPSTGNEAAEEVVQESVQSFALPGPSASNLERIRFAAANRLRVSLGYQGSHRDIEPYSLARSSDGDLLLRAVKSETREARTYRMDRIESATVTTTPFTPEYAIEITSSGYLPVHQLTRAERASSPRRSRQSGGLTYVFKCTQCNKTFRRKSMDAALKPHKKSNGGTCYGSYGRYIKSEW